LTIVEPDSLKEVYVMSGVAELPFNFPVAQSKDLLVYLYDTVLGDESVLIEDTDYTFDQTDPSFPTTGSITILDTAVYENTELQVTITRDTELVQEYDMEFEQDMNPVQLEFEQDRQCMMAQDMVEADRNSVRFPPSEKVENSDNILPTKAVRANSLLGFDENGDFSVSEDLLDEAVDKAVEQGTAEAEGYANSASASASASEASAQDSLDYALQAQTAQAGAELAETNVNNVINNASINEINFFLGSRVDSTATLTYGGRV